MDDKMEQSTQKQRPRIKKVGEYKIFLNEVLGEGGFGKVFVAEDTNKKEKVAIKCINREMLKGDYEYKMQLLKHQVSILEKIKDKNIVGYKGILCSARYYYIAQELCDEDLRKVIKREVSKNGGMQQGHALQIFHQILNGYYSLIVNGIVHRDLKPENILFNNKHMVKIADFGLAKTISDQGQSMGTRVGTPLYQSPQVFKGRDYTYKCDIWALGLILYEMLYGVVPFNQKNLQKMSHQQLNELHETIEDLHFPGDRAVTEECKDLIRACLRFKEEDRADYKYLQNHPLLKGKIKKLDGLEHFRAYIIRAISNEIFASNIDVKQFFLAHSEVDSKGVPRLQMHKFSTMLCKIIPRSRLGPDIIKYTFRYFDRDNREDISLEEFEEGLNYKPLNQITMVHSIIPKQSSNQPMKSNQNSEERQSAFKSLIMNMMYSKIKEVGAKYKIDQKKFKSSSERLEFYKKILKEISPALSSREVDLLLERMEEEKRSFGNIDALYQHLTSMLGYTGRES